MSLASQGLQARQESVMLMAAAVQGGIQEHPGEKTLTSLPGP